MNEIYLEINEWNTRMYVHHGAGGGGCMLYKTEILLDVLESCYGYK